MFQLQGQWRVFVRCRTSDNTTVTFRGYYGTSYIPDTTGLSNQSNNLWEMWDLGTIDIPNFDCPEPLLDGSDWAGLDAITSIFRVQCQTSAGTPTFDVDYILLLSEKMISHWGGATSGFSLLTEDYASFDVTSTVNYRGLSGYLKHETTTDPPFAIEYFTDQLFGGDYMWAEIGKNRIVMIINSSNSSVWRNNYAQDTFQCFVLAQPRWRRMR